jgi:hypothetical protein
VPAQTCLAASTWGSGLEGNAIADFKRRHSRADFDNCSCGFVPEYHWVFEDEGADPAFLPVVDITAADAGVVYGYEDIVGRLESGNRFFDESNVVRFVENEREVLQSSLLVMPRSQLQEWGMYAFRLCLCHCFVLFDFEL